MKVHVKVNTSLFQLPPIWSVSVALHWTVTSPMLYVTRVCVIASHLLSTPIMPVVSIQVCIDTTSS